MKKLLLSSAIFFSCQATAQIVVDLYPEGVPNSRPSANKEYTDTSGRVSRTFLVSQPTLTIYPVQNRPMNTAVIVIPGGGYQVLAADHEGLQIARALNEKGITAAVLKYRLPSEETMKDPSKGPLQDAQRAIQYLREQAGQLQIDPAKIGLMGFSAGGHLASTAGTKFRKAYIPNRKRTSLRPDFVCLVYPVISMHDSLAHPGSRERLLGKSPSEKTIRNFSAQFHINAKTPPFFLVHAIDDAVVSVKNSDLIYQKLREEDIAAGYYQYQKGGHGFGLVNLTSEVSWLNLLVDWLEENGFVH